MLGRSDRAGIMRRLVLFVDLWLLAGAVAAHEVTPTVADLSVKDGQVRLELRMNAEAFLVGIDLDRTQDTANSEQAGEYGALRATAAPEMETRLRDFAVDWVDKLSLEAEGPVSLSYEGARIPVVGDIGVARVTQMLLTGNLPDGARSLTLTWPAGAGVLILRQQGVEAPYTGYLQGGDTSPAIPIDGGASLPPRELFLTHFRDGLAHAFAGGGKHVLFVLALFFLSARARPLIMQFGAFLVADFAAIFLSVGGGAKVAPMLATQVFWGAVVLLAAENLVTRNVSLWRVLVILLAGGLHGLGAAGLLSEAGMAPSQLLPALAGFSSGIEAAQLIVLGVMLSTIGLWLRDTHWYRGRIAVPASLVIAIVAGYQLAGLLELI
ncbi:HupE/UreJ family protein [Ruegeria sp. HKCCD8929]|uniref:HupE/UreJ family protein n=1 Tax=Ruegeria sp. HKCCD8929 TaxID=2683006 RepID=UPI00148783B6|nr:HupE/UreJ family protein [Ruegeria sp. HKCCD8929]